MSRLDGAADILARGLVRALAKAALPQGDATVHGSVSPQSQAPQAGKSQEGARAVALVSNESVHVETPSPIGLGG